MDYFFIKRLLDVLIALSCIIILTPFFIICCLAIKFSSSGPVIFKDKRVGFKGETFHLLKFRTMFDNAGRGFVIKNDPRITSVGKIFRQTSIDELPQLFNVLKGDMSLIGPRPDLEKNYKDYSDTTMKRLNTRPGISGLAQCRGRNSIPWPERYLHDVEYVENISLSLDLFILFETLKIVILRESINIDET